MNYFTDHTYVEPRRFKPAATTERFGAVVGTIVTRSEREITGRNGEHLQSAPTARAFTRPT